METLSSWASKRDEELGKRDDNYRPAKGRLPRVWTPSPLSPGASAPRTRRRRLYMLLIVAAFIYIFHSVRSGGSSPSSRVYGGVDLGRGQKAKSQSLAPKDAPGGPPPKASSKTSGKSGTATPADTETDEVQQYYSGPIKFFNLKKTLESARTTGGYRDVNRNVMFAVSSLKSAANLLPLVCEMGNFERNSVHIAFLGRSSLPIDDILALNGIQRTKCRAWFHDARADYSEFSTDVRAEASVVGAITHIFSWLHPQVFIVDDSHVEDSFFVRGIRGKTQEISRPLIELPAKRYENFRWITRLTSSALSSWHKPRVEILVHSPPNAGGGVARLLKSLSKADFGGFQVPKLTVELPPETDAILNGFLNDFSWPPRQWEQSQQGPDLLKIHKRIPSTKLTSEESSIRFVESYFPAHYFDEHVLVLSPNAELSPSFFHYLMFTLLQSRYSAMGFMDHDPLAGFTLASPTSLLDGSGKFTPPPKSAMRKSFGRKKPASTEDSDNMVSPPYLWQAPSSDAMLIFGGRWAEFHDFLRRRLKSLHENPRTTKPTKVVSTAYPAWLEFYVELVRARGYVFLYPPETQSGAWMTIHQELRQTPEEFKGARPAPKQPEEEESAPADSASDEPFLVAKNLPEAPIEHERAAVSATQPLHELLPFDGDLPSVSELPLVSLQGTLLGSFDELDSAASKFTTSFRETLGGCSAEHARKPTKHVYASAGDLFCLKGAKNDFDDLEIDLDLLRPKTPAMGFWGGADESDWPPMPKKAPKVLGEVDTEGASKKAAKKAPAVEEKADEEAGSEAKAGNVAGNKAAAKKAADEA